LDFALPPNYHGYIFLVQDLSQSGELIEDLGKIRITIPPNGVVLVKNSIPPNRWFKLSAADYAGKKIQTGTEDNVDPNKPALFSLSSQASRRGDEALTYDVFMVGTASEMRNYLDNTAERKHATEELRIRLKSMKASP